MPDAEWYLHHGKELLAFCAQEVEGQTPLYLLNLKMNGMEFGSARLFRAESDTHFIGVVHEAPNRVATVKVPNPVFFAVNNSSKGIEKSRRRWQQDLELLSVACEKNPNDPRAAFYLGQTYECLNDLANAYKAYQRRECLSGWDEENFMTLYRLGGVAQRMMPQKSVQDWAVAMDYYLKAFALRPHRIEPLLRIAEYYWLENIQACYLFVRHAYSIPLPINDILFVEHFDYEYRRYEIMSRCAWYMGEFALGEQATLRAMEVGGDVPHLQSNLKLYQQKLREK